MLWFGGIVLSVLGFLIGRVFSQSESVLAEKRRVYEEFLTVCVTPNDAYTERSEELEEIRASNLKSVYGKLMLYAAPNVALAVSRYLKDFEEADRLLSPSSEALDPTFKVLAKSHNDLILEMRRDALGWSAFGYHGKSRLPADALENAKRNALD